MIDRTRDLIRNVRSLVTPSGAAPDVARPVELTISAPGISEGTHAALRARMQKWLEVRSFELELRRDVAVESKAPVSADAIWVFVGERPAAVLDADAVRGTGDDWVDSAVRQIKFIMQSRFALLLSDDERTEYARRIGDAVGDDRMGIYRDVPGYLLDNGVPPDPSSLIDKRARTEPTAAAVAELVLNKIAAAVALEVPMRVIRQTQDEDAELIPQMRIAVYEDTGVQFPDVTLQVVDDTAPIRLRVSGVRLDNGIPLDSNWANVVASVEATIKQHAAMFIRLKDIASQRDRLAATAGSLIELSRSAYSAAVIAACLRALVRSGQSVRNVQRMLWLMHDTIDLPESNAIRFPGLSADVPVDPRDHPEKLAARVRARIADEAWRVKTPVAPGPYVALCPEDGQSLTSNDVVVRASAERRIVAAYRAFGDVGLAVAPSWREVAPLRYALGAMAEPPRVVSIQELPLDAPITTLRL